MAHALQKASSEQEKNGIFFGSLLKSAATGGTSGQYRHQGEKYR